jgi:hypothetical protein
MVLLVRHVLTQISKPPAPSQHKGCLQGRRAKQLWFLSLGRPVLRRERRLGRLVRVLLLWLVVRRIDPTKKDVSVANALVTILGAWIESFVISDAVEEAWRPRLHMEWYGERTIHDGVGHFLRCVIVPDREFDRPDITISENDEQLYFKRALFRHASPPHFRPNIVYIYPYNTPGTVSIAV